MDWQQAVERLHRMAQAAMRRRETNHAGWLYYEMNKILEDPDAYRKTYRIQA